MLEAMHQNGSHSRLSVSCLPALLFTGHGPQCYVLGPVLHIPCLPAAEARFRAQACLSPVPWTRDLNPELMFSVILTASLQVPATHCSLLKMESA